MRRRDDRPHPCHGPTFRFSARRGHTLVELVVALAIVGVVAAVALPRVSRTLDGIAVHSATTAIAVACAIARSTAILRGTHAVVIVDAAGRRVTVAVGRDTVLAHPLDQPPYRLTLVASRDSITYGPTGLGFGTANTSVIVRQGAAADTLYTSRLGRVRH